MPISDKLAFEIYTIISSHVLAILLLAGFTTYIFFKAKKTPLLYSYIALVAMLIVWMISKILKTVSPNESIRWFFIVIQYFSIELVGFFLILFAWIYAKNRVPQLKTLILLAIPPLLSFIIVLTNPLHMQFYSYYDFYKDQFGMMFLPTQTVQYLYVIIGIIILSRGFTNQPGFHNRKLLSHLFALLTLIPLVFNIYYIIFKLTDLKWVFSFPIFDYTPIAGTIALILFMIPALEYRFFDISPISYRQLFEHIPEGIIFLSPKGLLYSANYSFTDMFKKAYPKRNVIEFANALDFVKEEDKAAFINFVNLNRNKNNTFLLQLRDEVYYKVSMKPVNKNHTLLCFIDLSSTIRLNKQLEQKNKELSETNTKLEALAESAKELAITRTQTTIAQNVHDILGHSLTVVIGTADLAAIDQNKASIAQNLIQIIELLNSSTADLKNSISGKDFMLNETTLTKAISNLRNSNITIDFMSQGDPYELNTKQTETIFRLCQEAVTNSMKHGKAKTVHIVLRFKTNEIEAFIIDDGIGCKAIKKNYGLKGIENRIAALEGTTRFGSDGENGFHIHVRIPKIPYQQNNGNGLMDTI